MLESSNGKIVLRADSDAAASGFYREMEINLGNTPFLNWSWKVSNLLTSNDERTRVGNDYLTF